MVGVETLVGIEHQRLQCIRARLTALYAYLAQLVEGTGLSLRREELNVHGATPVVGLLVLLAVVVFEEAHVVVAVQIQVVDLHGEDGRGHLPWVEDVRLCRAHGREPAVAEHLGADDRRLADADGLGVFRVRGGRFAAVGGIGDIGSLRTAFGQSE